MNMHYHIWRLSASCTAWFFASNWRGLNPRERIPNQFDKRNAAYALVVQREPDPRDRRRYKVLLCDGGYFCPMIHGRYS